MTIPKMNKKVSQTNGLEDKKVDDKAQAHQIDDVDYIRQEKEGGRGLVSIEDVTL